MTLENKLGITNSTELATKEEELSKKRAIEMFENGIFSTLKAGSFESLQRYINIYFKTSMILREKLEP